MCSIIAGLTALAGVVQYKSQQQQADAQEAMYRQQAETARRNAEIENRRQETIADKYADEQRRVRAQERLAEGQQRAAAGSAGMNFSGSMMDILSSSYEQANQDRLNLLNNQRQDNYNSRITESNFINQANSADAAADNVRSNWKTARWGTILGTASSVYGAVAPYKGGVFGGSGSSSTGTPANSSAVASNWQAANNMTFNSNYGFNSMNSARRSYRLANTGWTY